MKNYIFKTTKFIYTGTKEFNELQNSLHSLVFWLFFLAKSSFDLNHNNFSQVDFLGTLLKAVSSAWLPAFMRAAGIR